MPTPTEDTEARMGIEPIDQLLAEREHLVNQVVDLRAKYGPFGTWDHLRKITLSVIKGAIRAQAVRDKRKLNNEQVDEEAHAHPDYIELVTVATRERAEWAKLEARVEAIGFRINRGQSIARYLSSEPRA